MREQNFRPLRFSVPQLKQVMAESAWPRAYPSILGWCRIRRLVREHAFGLRCAHGVHAAAVRDLRAGNGRAPLPGVRPPSGRHAHGCRGLVPAFARAGGVGGGREHRGRLRRGRVARGRAVGGSRVARRLPWARRDGRHPAPATPHDAWLWISGSAPDNVWDHARAAARAVDDVAELATEQVGFAYRDGRDITGFVDGTANPPVRLAPDVALVPEGMPGAGGSHVS